MHFPQIHGAPSQSRFARQLPQRGSLWQAGSLSTGRLRLDRTQEGGPCLRGQRLLDNAPCQAVAGLGSGALLLPRYCASLVQTKADRHAKGSPFGATATTAASGGNREELLGQRPAGCERQRSRRWEPQPGLVERSETERLYEGEPDREPLLGSTSPSRLTPCHLPYRGEALAVPAK